MSGLLRVCLQPLCEGEIALDRAAARYVARVHRLRSGDRFVVFDPVARLEATALVLAVKGGAVRCRVADPRPAQLVSPLQATLIQAIGKGDRAEQIVRDATALGASRLLVVESQRSVVRLGARAGPRRARWRTIAVESARQCGRGDLPAIDGPISLLEALQTCRAAPGVRLCLDPRARASLAQALSAWTPQVPATLLVGPEGGLAREELKLARDAGFLQVSLGPFTLRTETAATAALAVLLHRLPG